MHYGCKNKGNHVEVLIGQEGLRVQKKKKKKKKRKERKKSEVFNPEVFYTSEKLDPRCFTEGKS
jgi:hypothetical protein